MLNMASKAMATSKHFHFDAICENVEYACPSLRKFALNNNKKRKYLTDRQLTLCDKVKSIDLVWLCETGSLSKKGDNIQLAPRYESYRVVTE